MGPLVAYLKFGALGKRVAKLRAEAQAQLRSVKISSTSGALVLDCTTAEVIDESESVMHSDGRVDAYYLTQVVRTEAGEYFLLKTTDKLPYVKHLLHTRVRPACAA